MLRTLVLTGLSLMAATAIATAIWPVVAWVVAAVVWVQLVTFGGAALVVAVRCGRARLARRRPAPEVLPASAQPVASPPSPPAADELVESA